MRFQVLSREEHSQQDADYETAVELVYYHMREATTNIKSEGGMLFFINESCTSKSTDYLEPCFDENNFTPGDPVHYVHTERLDDPQTRSEAEAFAYHILPLPELHDGDWGVYLEYKDTLGWEESANGIHDDQARRLNRYHAYQESFDEQLGEAYERGQRIPLNAGLFQAIASTKEGKDVSVNLSAMYTDLILALEYMHSTQREENIRNRRLNKISLAVWEAKQAIGEQVEQAHGRFNP